MRYLITLILALLLSIPAFATPIDDTKTVMQTLAGQTLSNVQMLSIATKFARYHRYANPWDEGINPVEYAAWPTNTELAVFFNNKMLNQILAPIGAAAGRAYDVTNQGGRDAVVIAAQQELLNPE